MKISEATIIKYKSLILYGFFGVATTGVNVVPYYIASEIIKCDTISSTIYAWILAVIFAYFTNRKWVFLSTVTTFKDKIKEFISFILCRLSTGVLDVVIMYVFVDLLSYNGTFVKLFSNIIVIVVNYITSKFLVFKRKEV